MKAEAKAAAAAAAQAAEDAKPKIRWPKLTSLTSYPLDTSFNPPTESEFQLPFDVRAVGRPPPFELLRRCQWACQSPPRLLPRDEVEACLCHPAPETLVAIAMAKEAAGAAATAKREAAAASAMADDAAAAAAALMGIVGGGGMGARDAAGVAPPPHEQPAAAPQQQQVVAVPRTGCGDECFNRSCHTTCDQRVCPCGPSCSNRPFHLLTSPRTKIVLTENRGWGLFLTESVGTGSFIVEYTGEIIDDKTCEERLWADKKRGEDNFYLMEVMGNQIIDARHKGNLSRFINSSCHPNCETQKWQDGSTGETRVGIFAIQDIPAGAELTYDYNFAHFGGEGTTSFTCMCGHPLCRGTLDANPERTRNYNRRLEIQWADKGFFPGTVLSYHNKTEKYQAGERHGP